MEEIHKLICDYIKETGKKPKFLIISENVRDKLVKEINSFGAYPHNGKGHATAYGLIVSTVATGVDDYKAVA